MILDDALVAYLRRAGRELDAALSRELRLAGITPARRRQTERNTMQRSEISGQAVEQRVDRVTYGAKGDGRDAPVMSMGETALAMSEQESSDRERLAGVSQWLGLLGVGREQLLDRVARQPLGQTTDEILQIQELQRFVGTLGSRLFDLSEGLRGALAEHLQHHDSTAQTAAEKAYAEDPRR